MAATDFTIADVLAWARTKPAGGFYDYTDASNCALCQFLCETGRATRPVVDPFGVMAGKGYFALPEGVNDAVQGIGRGDQPEELRWTFGEMVKRLERLCPGHVAQPADWTCLAAYMECIDAEQVSA